MVSPSGPPLSLAHQVKSRKAVSKEGDELKGEEKDGKLKKNKGSHGGTEQHDREAKAEHGMAVGVASSLGSQPLRKLHNDRSELLAFAADP